VVNFTLTQLHTAFGAEFWSYAFAKIFIAGGAAPIEKGKYQNKNDEGKGNAQNDVRRQSENAGWIALNREKGNKCKYNWTYRHDLTCSFLFELLDYFCIGFVQFHKSLPRFSRWYPVAGKRQTCSSRHHQQTFS
jgi:hypothetical protein